MVGIYQIRNSVTGACYIGSSASMNNRLKNHMTELALGRHINPKLQHAWNTHGPASFEFKIVEVLDDKYSLPERELFWIKKMGAEGVGFNAKSDQYKSRTLISVNMDTKKALERMNLGSMDKTIGKLLEAYRRQEESGTK